MKLSMYLNAVCLALVIVGTYGQRVCRAKRGRFFNKDEPDTRRCGRCVLCPPGQEWNMNVSIRTSPDRGDLECYPCVSCKDNFYKDTDTLRSCSPCLLKCEQLHRYLEVPCGGVKRCQCGSCKPGYEDTFLDTELPCTRPEEITGSSTSDTHPEADALPPTATPCTTPKNGGLTTDEKDIILFSLCGIVVILVGGFCTYFLLKCIKRQRFRNQDEEIPVDAQNVSSTTWLVQNRTPDSDAVANKANNSLLERYEIDGHADDEVRAEIQRYLFDSTTTYQEEIHYEFPCIRLTVDDRVLTIVAKNVFGRNTMILCHLLKVDQQTVFSEKELWTSNHQSYKDFVLNVLIKWIHRSGNNATLNILCDALHKAGCYEALHEVNLELRDRGIRLGLFRK